MGYCRLLSVLLVLVFLPLLSHAQKAQVQLEQRKKGLYREMNVTEGLLKDAQKSKTASMQSLILLDKQVANRQQVINTIETQLDLLDQSITTATRQIDSLDRTLRRFRTEYAEMVRQAYLTENSYSRLLFLFSANDINDAYQRMKYLQYYRDHRKNQLVRIAGAQELIWPTNWCGSTKKKMSKASCWAMRCKSAAGCNASGQAKMK